MYVQVEVVSQRRQLGPIYGLIRSRVLIQHATSAVWLLVSAFVFVIHDSDPLGCVSGNGHSWIRFLILVHIQDFCVCEGRLTVFVTPLMAALWDYTAKSGLLVSSCR